MTEQEVSELLEGSNWELEGIEPGVGADIVAISLSHPLSPGLIIELPETADRTEMAGRILGSSSFKLFEGAPVGEHHRLLAGLHAVAESHSWSPMERQSLAFLLAGHGLLDDEEARWFAEDSSLRGHQGD